MKIYNIPYTLKEVEKGVFLVTFKSAYDVAMTFCRVQEFYESPKFKNKFVKTEEYTRHYSLNHKNIFTYTNDWRGFNLPGPVIQKVYSTLLTTEYDTLTGWDHLMFGIVNKIIQKHKSENYYLIGTSKEKGDASVVKHEVAHGLYTTNADYKNKVNKAIKDMPPFVRNRMYKALGKMGYHKSVWKDELNAYISTGLADEMNTFAVRTHIKPFKELLNESMG